MRFPGRSLFRSITPPFLAENDPLTGLLVGKKDKKKDQGGAPGVSAATGGTIVTGTLGTKTGRSGTQKGEVIA